MEENEELELTFTPNENQILGVVGDMIYVKNFENVLIIPRNEYFRAWNLWIDCKQDYCKRYGHFCGVFGGLEPKEYSKHSKIILNEWSESEEDIVEREYQTYIITKFEDHVDMEHG